MLASEAHATVGSLAGALQLVMDPDVIATVVNDLHTTIDNLDAQAKNLREASGGEYGASPLGTFVAGHTGKAYTSVVQSMSDMNTAMQHYIQALGDLVKDTTNVDTGYAAAAKELTAAVECSTAATGGPGVCSPATGGA